jgi:hypothetical protein
MDNLLDSDSGTKKTFFNSVFSNTEESNAEIMNIIQYALLAIIPVVVLNKSIQYFIPEADVEKSSVEILAEVFFQIVIIFCGIIIIHRMIVYLPTYSGFKYERLSLTNVVLAFLIVVLSIQSKMGIKVNIMVDRLSDLWYGTTENSAGSSKDGKKKKNVRFSGHSSSQSDYLDDSQVQTSIFPPAPVYAPKPQNETHDNGSGSSNYEQQLAPANSLLGGSSFGSFF